MIEILDEYGVATPKTFATVADNSGYSLKIAIRKVAGQNQLTIEKHIKGLMEPQTSEFYLSDEELAAFKAALNVGTE